MIRFAAALLLIVKAAGADAQAALVRSGEHEDFTRLVIYFEATPDWVFGRVSDGYEFRPTEMPPGYALDEVYDLIPRDRIAAIEVRDGRLFLEVDCRCHGRAFEIPEGVVLDIRDGPAPEASSFERRLAAPAPATPGSGPGRAIAMPGLSMDYRPARTRHAWRESLALDLPAATGGPLLARAGQDGAPDPPDRMPGARQSAAPTPGDGVAPPRPTAESRVDRARASLVEQLGRAASQGLVVADIDPPPRPHSTAAPKPGRTADTPELPGAPPDPSRDNLRVETAVDRAHGEIADRVPMTPEGGDCLPSESLAIRTWGTPPGDGAGIAAYRADLLGEFDVAKPEGVTALARHYVYLTFGAEALALLGTFSSEDGDTDLLVALAEIMDDGRASRPGRLSGQIGCDTAAALWAAMARPSLPEGAPIATEAIIEAFAVLPLHLRRHIGPGLADRFLEIGDRETAATIRNSIARAPGKHGPGFALLDARLAIDLGAEDAGTDKLETLVDQDGPLAPEAVVRLIEARLSAELPVSAELLATAEALAFEHRDTPEGRALTAQRIRALAHAGAFRPALEALDRAEARGALAPDTVVPLTREVYARLARDAEDVTFLEGVLGGTPDLGDGPDAAGVERALAARLLDLRLSEPARALLRRGDRVPTPEDRLLYARSHLLDRRADLAIGYLAGLTSPEALELRARAHALADEHGRAREAFAEIGNADEAARAAWLGRDWEAARRLGPAERRQSAALAADPADPATEDASPTLAGSRALLERSGDVRTKIGSLLAAEPRP